MRRHLSVWSASFVVLGGLAVAAVGAAQTASRSDTVALSVTLPDNPAAGARLFVEKGCARCHALGGEDVKLGPDLGRIRIPGTVLDLAGTFWNHAPVMREKMRDLRIQRPTLDNRQMADLLAFLTAYRYYVSEVGGPGNPAAGHEVFRQKGCAGCHGSKDAWDKPGPSLDRYRGGVSPIMLAQVMWNHGSEMAVVMRGRGVPWPKFAGKEMGDLLAYLQTGSGGTAAERVYFEPGSPRRGQELFTAKRCTACHAIVGVGGSGGPDLGAQGRDLLGSVTAVAGLMWNHSQGMEVEFRRRGIPKVIFSGQEMADIVAYLYFVNYANVRGRPAVGEQLFGDKCAMCHTVGGGTRVGPDLITLPRLGDPIAVIAAMWNHAPRMEQELGQRGLPWPRLMPGDAADLSAFLGANRTTPGAPGEPPRAPKR
jgi:cytochrome c2